MPPVTVGTARSPHVVVRFVTRNPNVHTRREVAKGVEPWGGARGGRRDRVPPGEKQRQRRRRGGHEIVYLDIEFV